MTSCFSLVVAKEHSVRTIGLPFLLKVHGCLVNYSDDTMVLLVQLVVNEAISVNLRMCIACVWFLKTLRK